MKILINLFISILLLFVCSCGQIPSLFVGSRIEGYQDGIGENTKFGHSLNMAIDKDGNLFVADNSNHRIRKVTPDGQVTTFSGNGENANRDGNLKTASFELFRDMKFDSKGNLFVADKDTIRKITPDGEVTTFTIIIESKGKKIDYGSPNSMFIDKKDNIYLLKDSTLYKSSSEGDGEKYDLESKIPEKIPGFHNYGGLYFSQIIVDKEGNIYLLVIITGDSPDIGVIYKITPDNKIKKLPSAGTMTIDEKNSIYVSNINGIYKISQNIKDIREVKEISKFRSWFFTYFNSIYYGDYMVIDDKRKIMYLSDFNTSSIYKIKLEGDKK